MRTADILITDGTNQCNLYLQFNWFGPIRTSWRTPAGHVGHWDSGDWQYTSGSGSHGIVDLLEPGLPRFGIQPGTQPPVIVLSLFGVANAGVFPVIGFPFKVGQTGSGAHFVQGKLISASPTLPFGLLAGMTSPTLTWKVLVTT